jgi:hypothetical protein
MLPSYDSQNRLQIGSDDGFDPRSGGLDFRKHFLLGVPCRKPQNIAVAPLHPLCRKPPQLAPKSRDIPMLNLLWQTQELESQNQVVGPKDRLQVGSVGPEARVGMRAMK